LIDQSAENVAKILPPQHFPGHEAELGGIRTILVTMTFRAASDATTGCIPARTAGRFPTIAPPAITLLAVQDENPKMLSDLGLR